MIDLAGVALLTELRDELRARGIEAHIAETRGPTRDALRRAGVDLLDARVSVAAEIARWQAGDWDPGAGGAPG
jgi:MFS superfamily sulfate permease-like transporter